MFEFLAGLLSGYTHPANLIVGGALVSSPIIIHLINRMRFKRVPWAAMEFLLKSQQRNRRRLIIEQIILLLLRILLVLLTGLLLARFLGASLVPFGSQQTLNLILLDDRLSMSDQWKDGKGERKNTFQQGKKLIEEDLARSLLKNRSSQRLVVRRLSEPTPELFDKPLNDSTMKDLAAALTEKVDCTQLHLDLNQGVAQAREFLAHHAAAQRSLYIVSDFRQRHWFEPEAKDLIHGLQELVKAKVKIFLIDAADPARTEKEKQHAPPYHDNLAITELRPDSRVAAQNVPVQIKASVANYGAGDRPGVKLTLKVNGAPVENRVLQSLQPGKVAEAVFLVSFEQLGFNQLSAHIENDDFGLTGDNVRYAVVEVKKQVEVLVIDGDAGGDKPGGDTYHLRTLFNKAARGFQVVSRPLAELEQGNLDRYASIFLLNVRELVSETQLKNLKDFVHEGGGVVFFMGDLIQNADYYNQKLYEDGKGIFPAPLVDQPTPRLSQEERAAKMERNLKESGPKAFLRNEKHPILANIYKYRPFLTSLDIERYHRVERSKWNVDPNRVEELISLPNERPLGDADRSDTLKILKDLAGLAAKKENARYRPGLENHAKSIDEKLKGSSLPALASAVEELLKDKESKNDASLANLQEFWGQADPAVQELRERVEKLYASMMGDPLVIAGTYGKGRTVAVLTTAGKKWNNWAGGDHPAAFLYIPFMLDLQAYLSSWGSETQLTVGTSKEFDLDASRYLPSMSCKSGQENLGEQKVTESKGRLHFEFKETKKPGIYNFEFTQKSLGGGAKPSSETRAFAFNVDASNESDLRRAAKADLEGAADGVKLFAPGNELTAALSDKKNDLSESAWLYLAFLVILVAEQAMAVHLSYHLKGSEAQPPAQATRPQPTAA